MSPRLLLVLVCLIPALASAEERLGRLFFTPTERANLDYVRQTSKPPERVIATDKEEAEGIEAAPPPPAVPAAVTVQGFVKRSDGRGTVWVNRQPVLEKSAKGEVEVGKVGDRNNRVQVRLPSTGQVVELKAGQTYDPASGKVVENARELPSLKAAPAVPPPEKKGVVENQPATVGDQQTQVTGTPAAPSAATNKTP